MQQANLFIVVTVYVAESACFQGAFRPRSYSDMLFVKMMGFVCEKVFQCLIYVFVACRTSVCVVVRHRYRWTGVAL